MSEPQIDSIVIAYTTVPDTHPEIVSTELSVREAGEYKTSLDAALSRLSDEEGC